MQGSETNFEAIKALLYARVGFRASVYKDHTLKSRLNSFILQHKIKDLKQLLTLIQNHFNSRIILELIDFICVKHTYFFREPAQFDFLCEQLTKEIENKKGQINIWCAAMSSGEEAYSLAVTLIEHFGLQWFLQNVRILGTDISMQAVSIAEQGIYSQDRLKQWPPVYKQKYITLLENNMFQINKNIREKCHFRRLNLSSSEYPFKNRFQIIFCRNVFIYFTPELIQKITRKMFTVSDSGAWLFLSHTESLNNYKQVPWKYLQPGIYKKV